jgi:hypothetical protein
VTRYTSWWPDGAKIVLIVMHPIGWSEVAWLCDMLREAHGHGRYER